MKFLKIWAAVALLLAGCAVSFCVGHSYGSSQKEKYYNDASRMSDLIRCYQDHLNDTESIIEDYGCFEELEGIFLYDDALGEVIDLREYAYCY